MVDQVLLKTLKGKFDAGSDDAEPDDILKLYEFLKQAIEESDELKEEIENMDISIQLIIKDADKKYWVKIQNDDISYGAGEIENPSFTLSAPLAIGAGILYGEIDATSAYMAGDITVEGNLQDALAFQEIIELGMQAFEDLTEDL